MKRILVAAAVLITVLSFLGCYPSGVGVRSGPPRYYAPRPYYGYGRPHYYGGYRRHRYGYGYHRW